MKNGAGEVMNEVTWMSYICVHTGRYTTVLYPDKGITERLLDRIQQQAAGRDDGRINQVLTYIDGYAVIAGYGPQDTKGAKTYYSYAVMFPQSLELQYRLDTFFYRFLLITTETVFGILDKVKGNEEESRRWLGEYVQSRLEEMEGEEWTEDSSCEFQYNKDTLSKTVCRCLYMMETNGKGIRICVPEDVEYSEYCKWALHLIFSCIPYGLRDGISFATNPSQADKDFKIVFVRSLDGEGISLELPWEEKDNERYDNGRETLVKALLKDVGGKIRKQLYDELELPNAGKCLLLYDYVDYWILLKVQSSKGLCGFFLKGMAAALKRDRPNDLNEFFENKIQNILMKKGEEYFNRSKIESVFKPGSILPNNFKGYGELLVQLDFYQEILERIQDIGGRKQAEPGLFSEKFGEELLKKVWEKKRPKDYLESMQEDVALLTELKQSKEKLRWYFGDAVEKHEKGLPTIEERQQIIEKLNFLKSFVRELEQHQDGEELAKIFRMAENLEKKLGAYLAKGKDLGNYAKKLPVNIKNYAENHYMDFTREEIQSGEVKIDNKVRVYLNIWREYGKEIRNLLPIDQGGDENWDKWIDNIKKKQNSALSERCSRLQKVEDFCSYLLFAEECRWEETIMELLRDLTASERWSGGKDISSFARGAMQAMGYAEEGRSGRTSYERRCCEELSALIKGGYVKLYLRINRGRGGLQNDVLEELGIWYRCCNGADELLCVSTDGLQEDLTLFKKDMADKNFLRWKILGEIRTENAAELELIWKRMVPMGYYSIREWWEEFGNDMKLESYSVTEKLQIQQILFSWVVCGPGIPWDIKERICQKLLGWGWLGKDKQKIIKESGWLTDMEKQGLKSLLRKAAVYNCSGKREDKQEEQKCIWNVPGRKKEDICGWELGLRELEDRIMAAWGKRRRWQIAAVAAAAAVAAVGGGRIGLWLGKKDVRLEEEREGNAAQIMDGEEAIPEILHDKSIETMMTLAEGMLKEASSMEAMTATPSTATPSTADSTAGLFETRLRKRKDEVME